MQLGGGATSVDVFIATRRNEPQRVRPARKDLALKKFFVSRKEIDHGTHTPTTSRTPDNWHTTVCRGVMLYIASRAPSAYVAVVAP
jgi:hypothetical protein